MKTLILFITLLVTSSSFAGPGHGHSHGPKDQCKKLATNDLKTSSFRVGKCHIRRLIVEKKLDGSWSNANHLTSTPKEFLGKKEWIITFQNDKGTKGKTLYIFLKPNGDFIAANFTGK